MTSNISYTVCLSYTFTGTSIYACIYPFIPTHSRMYPSSIHPSTCKHSRTLTCYIFRPVVYTHRDARIATCMRQPYIYPSIHTQLHVLPHIPKLHPSPNTHANTQTHVQLRNHVDTYALIIHSSTRVRILECVCPLPIHSYEHAFTIQYLRKHTCTHACTNHPLNHKNATIAHAFTHTRIHLSIRPLIHPSIRPTDTQTH